MAGRGPHPRPLPGIPASRHPGIPASRHAGTGCRDRLPGPAAPAGAGEGAGGWGPPRRSTAETPCQETDPRPLSWWPRRYGTRAVWGRTGRGEGCAARPAKSPRRVGSGRGGGTVAAACGPLAARPAVRGAGARVHERMAAGGGRSGGGAGGRDAALPGAAARLAARCSLRSSRGRPETAARRRPAGAQPGAPPGLAGGAPAGPARRPPPPAGGRLLPGTRSRSAAIPGNPEQP
jgi:hypothetical protein